MYVPPAFRNDDLASIHATIQASRLASLVTSTENGLIGTPLPLMVDPAKANSAQFTATSPRPTNSGASPRSAKRLPSSWAPTPT